MDGLKVAESLILSMVRAIVSKPEEVELHISEQEGEKGTFTQINIKVAKEDIPTTIGSKGVTADSIRRLGILAAHNAGYMKSLFIRVDAPRMPANHYYPA